MKGHSYIIEVRLDSLYSRLLGCCSQVLAPPPGVSNEVKEGLETLEKRIEDLNNIIRLGMAACGGLGVLVLVSAKLLAPCAPKEGGQVLLDLVYLGSPRDGPLAQPGR